MTDTTVLSPTIAHWGTRYRDLAFENQPGFTHYLGTQNPIAVYVWDEAHRYNLAFDSWDAAHAENERRNRQEPTESRDAMARALMAMRKRESEALARARDLEAKVTALRDEQLKGDDPRLESFWQRAQEVADDANYCEVFDNLASELGGPTRSQPGIARVRVTLDVNVNIEDLRDYEIDESDIKDALYDLTRYDMDITSYDVMDEIAD